MLPTCRSPADDADLRTLFQRSLRAHEGFSAVTAVNQDRPRHRRRRFFSMLWPVRSGKPPCCAWWPAQAPRGRWSSLATSQAAVRRDVNTVFRTTRCSPHDVLERRVRPAGEGARADRRTRALGALETVRLERRPWPHGVRWTERRVALAQALVNRPNCSSSTARRSTSSAARDADQAGPPAEVITLCSSPTEA
jgi:hypothetical protein